MIKTLITIPLFITIIFSALYLRTSENSNLAKELIVLICDNKQGVPTQKQFKAYLSGLNAVDIDEWYYFIQKDNRSFYIQYPVNFWHRGAIGKPKISEFIPLPYSYSVKVDCLVN